jgi:hypothetical protein
VSTVRGEDQVWDHYDNWANQHWETSPDTTSLGPATIPPGATSVFISASGFGFNGTGASLNYKMQFPPGFNNNDTIQLFWAGPWQAGFAVNACDASVTTTVATGSSGGGFGQTFKGHTEDLFTVVTAKSSDGVTEYVCGQTVNAVEFEVTQTKPLYTMAKPTEGGTWSGNAGDQLELTGPGLGPGMQVLFGTTPASYTCSSSSVCTVTVPWSSGANVVPVVLEIGGFATTFTHFSYLTTPGCTFVGSGTGIIATCNSDSALDPVWILRQNSVGGWDVVHTFPQFAWLGPVRILNGLPAGVPVNLVSCIVDEGGYLNSTPGTPSCDNFPTAVIPPGVLHRP